jgi:hypothetical protein
LILDGQDCGTGRVQPGHRRGRLARSWTYSGARPPETVRDAVLRLGTVPLLNLVLGDYLARSGSPRRQRGGQEHRHRPGRRGFNLTVDSGAVRRLGRDFTRYARICLQTDTWLRELRAAQRTPLRA